MTEPEGIEWTVLVGGSLLSREEPWETTVPQERATEGMGTSPLLQESLPKLTPKPFTDLPTAY